MTRGVAWLCLLAVTTWQCAARGDDELIPIAEIKRDAAVDFEKEVLPLLKQNCVACHNATKAEGGLVLESPGTIAAGGDSGPAVVAGQGGESLLLARARGVDSIMPPEDNKVGAKPLSPEQLGLLKLWIDQGATGTVSGAASEIQWQSLPPGINPIFAVALAPDGQYAACSRANQVFVYHVPTGKFTGKLSDPELVKSGVYQRPGVADLDLVQSLAFSPDGNLLATGGYRTIKLWRRPRDVRSLDLADVAGRSRQAVAISPDGGRLAVANGQEIRLVDVAGGKVVGTLAGHGEEVTGLAFAADGKQLVSAALDKSLRLWNAADGKPAATIESPAAVTALVLAGQPQQIVTGGADGVVRVWVWPAADAAPLDEPVRPARELAAGKRVTALAAGAALVVSGSEDGQVIVWNLGDGKPSRQVKHPAAVAAVAIRGDGKVFASAGEDKTVRVWNAADGKQLAEMKGDYRAQARVAALEREVNVAKSLVGVHTAAVAAAEKTVTIEGETVKKAKEAQTAAGKTLKEKQAAAEKAGGEKKSAEKAHQTVVAEADKAEKAKAAADKELATAEAAEKKARDAAKAAETAAAKNKDDQPLAEAHEAARKAQSEAAARVTAAREAKSAADKAHAGAVAKVKPAADDLEKKSKAAEEAETALKDAHSGKASSDRALASAEAAEKRAAEAVRQEQERLAQAQQRQEQSEAARDEARQAAAAAEKPIRSLAFSPDGTILAGGGDDALIHIWSGETGQPFDVLAGHQQAVGAVSLAGAARLVSAAADGRVVVWNLAAEWSWLRTIGAPGSDALVDRVTALAFSADGKRLASGGGAPSRSGELKLWNVDDGSLVRDFGEVHSDTVLGLEFSPDGKHLASCGADKFVKVFDVAGGELIRSFEGHTHHVLGVSWKADGRVLASGGADSVVKVWDFVTGDQQRTITGFGKEVTAVKFVADTVNLVAACGDKTVRLYDTTNGRNIRTYSGGADFMYAVAVSPDGKLCLAGGQDSVLRVWNVDDGRALHALSPPAETSPPQQAQR